MKNDKQNLDKNDELEKDNSAVELDKVTKEMEEFKNKYLRAFADYQNLERRVKEEKAENYKYIAEKVMAELLPIIDSLSFAAMHIKDKGLDLVLKDLYNLINNYGLRKIECVGQKFDPSIMECIEVIEGKNGIVIEETSSGYMIENKLIRAAKVKVGQENIK